MATIQLFMFYLEIIDIYTFFLIHFFFWLQWQQVAVGFQSGYSPAWSSSWHSFIVLVSVWPNLVSSAVAVIIKVLTAYP